VMDHIAIFRDGRRLISLEMAMLKELSRMAKADGKTIYRYCGDGLGIPGLPHQITRDIARESGVLAELDAAIAAGVYIAVAEKPAPEA